jgi:hypothetical protein
MATNVCWIGSSNTLELSGLNRYGVIINDARITLTIRSADGETIAGPTIVRHIENSNGDYAGGFSAAVGLVAGQKYVAVVDADVGTDVGHWEVPFTAQVRKK